MYNVYDSGYRGNCPLESAEQVTFFNWIRSEYPDTFGALAFHVRNEGKRTAAQAQKEKAEGMTKGVVDIIIPGKMTFVCELKRQDKTKSRLPNDEREYLIKAWDNGAFACLCYGYEEAIKAFEDWRSLCCS
jgi:hypothetical protein